MEVLDRFVRRLADRACERRAKSAKDGAAVDPLNGSQLIPRAASSPAEVVADRSEARR
jgi:hypothetical protein